MYLKIKIETTSNTAPTDYRRHFMYIIKSLAKGTKFEDMVLSRERLSKPYTFSVEFLELDKITSDEITYSSSLVFQISSPISEFIEVLASKAPTINGMKLFRGEIKNIDVSIQPHEEITSNSATFKILGGAVLIRNKKGKDYYVLPFDEDFEDSFKYLLRVKINYFKDTYPYYFDEIKDLNLELVDYDLTTMAIKHYGGYVKGFRGKMTIKASRELLNLIHKLGVGVRTSQGFGMVRVLSMK